MRPTIGMNDHQAEMPDNVPDHGALKRIRDHELSVEFWNESTGEHDVPPAKAASAKAQAAADVRAALDALNKVGSADK